VGREKGAGREDARGPGYPLLFGYERSGEGHRMGY
jgi:hypothetical protein